MRVMIPIVAMLVLVIGIALYLVYRETECDLPPAHRVSPHTVPGKERSKSRHLKAS